MLSFRFMRVFFLVHCTVTRYTYWSHPLHLNVCVESKRRAQENEIEIKPRKYISECKVVIYFYEIQVWYSVSTNLVNCLALPIDSAILGSLSLLGFITWMLFAMCRGVTSLCIFLCGIESQMTNDGARERERARANIILYYLEVYSKMKRNHNEIDLDCTRLKHNIRKTETLPNEHIRRRIEKTERITTMMRGKLLSILHHIPRIYTEKIDTWREIEQVDDLK